MMTDVAVGDESEEITGGNVPIEVYIPSIRVQTQKCWLSKNVKIRPHF